MLSISCLPEVEALTTNVWALHFHLVFLEVEVEDTSLGLFLVVLLVAS